MNSRNLKTLQKERSIIAILVNNISRQTSKDPEKTKGDMNVSHMAGITNKRKDSHVHQTSKAQQQHSKTAPLSHRFQGSCFRI